MKDNKPKKIFAITEIANGTNYVVTTDKEKIILTPEKCVMKITPHVKGYGTNLERTVYVVTSFTNSVLFEVPAEAVAVTYFWQPKK